MPAIMRYLTLLLIACIGSVSSTYAETPQEYTIKAGYLVNLPLFSDWSPGLFTNCSAFSICIIGETPLYDSLDSIHGRKIKNRAVSIRRVREVSELTCCQVLFIATSERFRLQKLLPEAHRRGIMTISDMRDFTRAGGMVALTPVNNRIGFDLNLAAARSASISFSSQLLKLANDVVK